MNTEGRNNIATIDITSFVIVGRAGGSKHWFFLLQNRVFIFHIQNFKLGQW
jgi:hypothetical protein